MSRTPIDCEEALRMLAAFLDHELDDVAVESMHAHLDTCRSCFSRTEFERQLRRRLAELRGGRHDAALGARIHGMIRQLGDVAVEKPVTDTL